MSNPHVLLETSQGDILLELFPDSAPESVANFLGYVDDGHYDGTIFHRVVRGFVIQGGGFDRRLSKLETRGPVRNESRNGLSNRHGAIALARGPETDSARDEFFINAADNPELDWQDDSDEWAGYAVFGRVVEGLEVVKKINWKVVKAQPGFPELPQETVSIISASRFE